MINKLGGTPRKPIPGVNSDRIPTDTNSALPPGEGEDHTVPAVAKEGARSGLYLKVAAALAVAAVGYKAFTTEPVGGGDVAISFPLTSSTRIIWDGEGDGLGIAGGIGDISAVRQQNHMLM